jgi:hypothetical protein
MKRRNFVLLTTVAAVALVVPFASCGGRRCSLVRTLARPDFLSQVCDGATILEIGAAYRAQTPSEAREDRLIDLLLAEIDPTRSRPADNNSAAADDSVRNTADSDRAAVSSNQLAADSARSTTDDTKDQLPTISDTQLAQSLALHIKDNYISGKVVTLKGWVLSLTEARQCALYTYEMQ